eukprot:9145262-Pyramimonas_sp.AAC.1
MNYVPAFAVQVSSDIGEEVNLRGRIIDEMVRDDRHLGFANTNNNYINLTDNYRVGREGVGPTTISAWIESSMTLAQAALKKSLRTINKLYKEGTANHMTVLVLFVFIVFIIVYFFMKANRVAKFVSGS